jgi:hypothetical protein
LKQVNNLNMSGARIIQLGAQTSTPQAVSFEEAFGEYSNARGRGRERRKARKLDRIENRAEVKAARQGTRQEKIANRQSVRAQRTAGRGELQQMRKAQRLGKREMGLDSRLSRREQRTQSRVGRRDLRNPQFEVDQNQMYDVENTQQIDTGYAPQDTGYAPQDTGYAPQDTGYAPQDTGYTDESGYYDEDPGYAPQDTGYTDESGYYDEDPGLYEDPATYSDEFGEVYDQSLIDETAENAYDMGYEDAQDDLGLDVEITGDEDYGDFDGVMGAEDRYNELQDKNDMPVNPQVQQMADKCVWNQMLITKLKDDRKKAKGNPQQISKTILERQKRLKDLQNALEAYVNDLNGFSNADSSPQMIAQRKRSVQMALNKARRKAAGQSPVSVTGVSRGLNPKMSRDRIVVNSSETMSSATGITALDDSSDYDAPDTREFFIPADGGFTKGIDLGSIALGALITVGFIYLNRQYKWIKM